MKLGRKEVGYAIFSRLEESFRYWLASELVLNFGADWINQVPDGIWEKTSTRNEYIKKDHTLDAVDLLDESDFPDLLEIMIYRKAFNTFLKSKFEINEFKDNFQKLYEIRCSIAHIKRSFSAIDLDVLIELTETMVPILGEYANELNDILDIVKDAPSNIAEQIPMNFYIEEAEIKTPYLNNLPVSDYDPDGGFVGRRDDLKKIRELIHGEAYRNVITVIGAGGVGKTAIVHNFCQDLIKAKNFNFDALVWVSAKEEKLTVTGIEPIEPTLRSYEDVLDTIIDTFDFKEYLTKSVAEKEELVEIILKTGEKGILLVVDNLETIRDERVIEFIKDFPPPSRVLITSRKGLGEVERRYPLKEMTSADAVLLLRTIAREKGANSLSKLPHDILSTYVDKMARYPLAIKWVIGQVALGQDLNTVIEQLSSSEGDVAKFSFEQIYSILSEDAKLILFALSSFDKSLGRGILSHVANLTAEQLDDALSDLTLASLVVPTQFVASNSSIETNYELLPLTRNFILSKLQGNRQIYSDIRSRITFVESLIQEADKASKQYRYSLYNLGAESEEEKISSTWAMTAFQRYQADDYNGAVEAYIRAAEIAPKFSAIYRNWASMESQAGYPEKANDLMKKATSLSPKDAGLWFVWGNIEKRRQRYDKAADYLKKALEISPNDPPILGALGEVEKRRGNFEDADILLHKALTEGRVEKPKKHEIVCYTSMADNYRRWAEELSRERKYNESLDLLKKAYSCAERAIDLGEEDYQAQSTFNAVTTDLAIRVNYQKSFAESIPYFLKVVIENPKKAREKKTNERVCFFLATGYLQIGEFDLARKYFFIGRKSLIAGSTSNEKYNNLALEFTHERALGILKRIKPTKGFGFIESIPHDGHNVFLHYTDMHEDGISIEDFEGFVGSKINFIKVKNDRGFIAKRAYIEK